MSSAKTWFVRTGFGTILGPMPEDALREMVRTGALVRADEVREDDNSKWHLASETPGLFDVASQATSELLKAPSSEEECEAAASVNKTPPNEIDLSPPELPRRSGTEPDARKLPTEAHATKHEVIARPDRTDAGDAKAAPPETAAFRAPDDDASVPQSAPPTNDLIAAWKAERVRSKEELGMVSLAADMNRFHDQEDYAPELPADLLSDDQPVTETAPSPPASSAASKPPTTVATPIRSTAPSRPMIQRPAFLDQVPGLEDGPRRVVEATAEKPNRLRRSVSTWPLVAIIVVALLAWWFWPRSQRGIYDRYAAIWEEWKTRRTDFRDPESWNRFLKRAESELNETVPWLEKHARSSDREKQLLLYIGRDCLQKMLKQPRQMGTPSEEQLQVLLASARDLYEPSASASRGTAAEVKSSMNGNSKLPAATGTTAKPRVNAPTNDTSPKSTPQ